jgi:uncharacterized membrane protein YphA (DoxX/SURF4 family)
MVFVLPSPRTYASWLAALRIYTGIFWLLHGVPKLLNPKFFGSGGMMVGMIQDTAATTTGLYHDFLVNVVVPHAALFSHLVAWGETLTGVSLLLGLFTRLGGLVGIFLPLNYFMMKGAYTSISGLGGMDAAAMALSAINLALPTGLIWGLDGVLPWSRLGRRSAGER